MTSRGAGGHGDPLLRNGERNRAAGTGAATPTFLPNPALDRTADYGERQARAVRPDGARRARASIRAWPEYRHAPLRRLPALASELGLGALLCKDESDRFGLGSFKALGGAWAVGEALRRTGDDPSDVTVACASAGNHGRAVAWGAERFGCRSVVYLPEGTSDRRERAIASHGARVVRPALDYDDAVREVYEDARREDWTVISDTAGRGDPRIPRDVMEGYTLLVEEALEQADVPPTHVFVQAGVGGLAAAVTAHLWTRLGADRPTVVVVEAEGAAALLESARAGHRRELDGPVDTAMRCLACTLAREVLGTGAHVFATIGDEDVEAAVERLAEGRGGDPRMAVGTSGAAGLAALVRVARRPALREALGLGRESRALVIATEGAPSSDT